MGTQHRRLLRGFTACAALLALACGGLRAADRALPADAGPELAAAVSLLAAKKYPEARAALEKLTAAEPRNAAAAYFLGRAIERRSDTAALSEAITWYQRAVELAPQNPTYLGRYGGALLLLAERTRSYANATRGRDAMEQAIRLDPDDLDAREGLLQFYQRAPWPLGSSRRAAEQLEAIRKRDPDRGLVLSVQWRISAKDYATAFRLCDDVLQRKPDDYLALFHYGRVAALSGQQLERGIECLKKCTTLPPPGPAAPPTAAVWHQVGLIEELRHRVAEARAAYEAALQSDPQFPLSRERLAALR